MKSLDYKLLQSLDAIIAEQSFDGASKRLNITQSAISQRIKLLEEQCTQPVLVRGTPLKVTALGAKLLSHYQQIMQLESDLLTEINPEKSTSPVPISIALNADSIASWFIPAIADVLKIHNIELDLHVVNESISPDFIKNGKAFAAISDQPTGSPKTKVTPIGNVVYKLCAHPSFKEKYFANGLDTKSLRLAPGINYDHMDNMHYQFIEQHFGLTKGEYPCHRVRSAEGFVNLALNGVAYSLYPEPQIAHYLASGALIDLAPNLQLNQPLYWHSWILEQGLRKVISDQIINWGRKNLHG